MRKLFDRCPWGQSLTVRNFALVSLCCFLLILLVPPQPAYAFGVHYETDKQYYHPGDFGVLLLQVTNDASSDALLFRAYMNITGIGSFVWNTTGLRLATNLPPDIHAYAISPGQMVTIRITFTIPNSTKPGDYTYWGTIVWSSGNPWVANR